MLFVVTLISTLFIGALNSGTFARDILSHPLLLLNGAPFSFTLIIILGLHEFSHYFVSKRYGIRTSLPYFIPFPNIIGTMGAVIISRSPFVDRKSLFDVGIAGPLASFVLSIGAIILGFSGMTLVRISPHILRPEPGIYLGDSLLTTALFGLRYHQIPLGFDINLGPIGFAGVGGALCHRAESPADGAAGWRAYLLCYIWQIPQVNYQVDDGSIGSFWYIVFFSLLDCYRDIGLVPG